MDRIGLFLVQRKFTYETEAWFAPLTAALEGLGAKEAAWQPPGAGNTIWQTLNHINYYNEQLVCHMTGEDYPRLPDNDATFGEPGDPEDTAGWQATVERTHRIAQRLRTLLESKTDADMDADLLGMKLGIRLAQWIGHDAYHTGQIVLIRKQQGSWPVHRG